MNPLQFSRRTAASIALLGLTALAGAPSAHALTIVPTFDATITSNGNAAAIEGAINSAISAIDGLYSNNVTLDVTFKYAPGAPGNLLSTDQFYQSVSYNTFKTALQADSTANPSNTVLATALAHLSQGNDANGSRNLAVADGLFLMLGLGNPYPGDAVPIVSINSNQAFDFSHPTSGNFDLIGGLEHELDEVLGGGGGGSTLNGVAGNPSCSSGNTFFCSKDGPLDLYRYNGNGSPSFNPNDTGAYFSIDGGATSIVGFNSSAGPCNGDDGDFAPNGNANGQLIQNACNGAFQDEDYTTSSPEFIMEEALGWNGFAAAATPEPASLSLFGAAIAGVAAIRRRNRR